VATARQIWTRLETIHAVTYFAPESREAADACGLRGFWMGYFAFRAAPIGAVGHDVVNAALFNFAPVMVARAIPDAWARAEPVVLRDARRRSAAAALRRVAPVVDRVDSEIVVGLIDAIRAVGPAPELPLFTANRALGPPTDVAAALWQQCTTLREHRGDAHVASLRAAELDGCEAHVLFAADQEVPEALLRDHRGWTAMEWEMARAALVNRGLITATGAVTPDGRALRAAVEAATDARAAEAFGALDTDAVVAALDPIAHAVVASGIVPFPNPMGLPRLGTAVR
jgi:hypothetical protein